MRRQLAGEALAVQTAGELREDVSTDEMTPVWTMLFCDQRMGDYVYLGLQREERIYRQNCQNLGLLTSTDFNLLERIEAGHPVTVADFVTPGDEVTTEIVRAGGLFAYNRLRTEGRLRTPVPDAAARPMTYAEKIIARAVVTRPAASADLHDVPGTGVQAVQPGDTVFVRPSWRFSYGLSTTLGANLMQQAFGAGVRVREPATRRLHAPLADHHQRDQQELPRPLRPGRGLACQPLHRCRECLRGAHIQFRSAAARNTLQKMNISLQDKYTLPNGRVFISGVHPRRVPLPQSRNGVGHLAAARIVQAALQGETGMALPNVRQGTGVYARQ